VLKLRTDITKLHTEKSDQLVVNESTAISNKEAKSENNDTKDLPESSVSMFHKTVATIY